MKQFTVSVYNINLADVRPDDAADYARRLQGIANLLKADTSRPWQFIGLNECKSQRQGTFYETYEQEDFVCSATGRTGSAAECLAQSVLPGGNPTVLSLGELGLIAEEGTLSWAGGDVLQAEIGYAWPGAAKRKVFGARFRHRSGSIIPFITTHVTAFSDKWYTIDQCRVQLEDMASAIRHWWTPGDTVPILVGDFNSHEWSADLFPILENGFRRIIGGPGGPIEHIYVGKRGSFRSSSGGFVPVKAESLTQYDDNAVNLSDHAAQYAVLQGPVPQFLLNLGTNEFHDLDRETRNCQISEILDPAFFESRNAAQTHRPNLDNCAYCLGGSKR